MKTNKCVDCGKVILGSSRRCIACSNKNRLLKPLSERRNYCMDCGKEIKYSSERCHSCAMKRRFLSEDAREKQREKQLGTTHKAMTKEGRENISKGQIERFKKQEELDKISGEKSCHWKGGDVVSHQKREKIRRGYGFFTVNERGFDMEGHHLTKDLVLFIPTEVHKTKGTGRHTPTKPETMTGINMESLKWLVSDEGVKTLKKRIKKELKEMGKKEEKCQTE